MTYVAPSKNSVLPQSQEENEYGGCNSKLLGHMANFLAEQRKVKRPGVIKNE